MYFTVQTKVLHPYTTSVELAPIIRHCLKLERANSSWVSFDCIFQFLTERLERPNSPRALSRFWLDLGLDVLVSVLAGPIPARRLIPLFFSVCLTMTLCSGTCHALRFGSTLISSDIQWKAYIPLRSGHIDMRGSKHRNRCLFQLFLIGICLKLCFPCT